MTKRQVTDLGTNYCIFCGEEVFASITAEVICEYCTLRLCAGQEQKEEKEQSKRKKSFTRRKKSY